MIIKRDILKTQGGNVMAANGNCLNALIKYKKDDVYQQHYSPIKGSNLLEMIVCLMENVQSGHAYAEMIVDSNGKVLFSVCADDLKD